MKKFSPENSDLIHFSGIGGIGMSGIAEILNNLGYQVQGSDKSKNYNTDRLEKLGIKIFSEQKELNIENATVIVRSSAVKDNNPEIIAARKNSVPVIARADMLKEIMHLKNCVTVAGTHGKTTTTSMIAHLFESAKLEPTVINGGILNSCGTNAYLGKGDWLIAEADESDGSFNKLPANVAVVTNIDPEHMEFYGSMENLRKAFKDFVEKVPFYGFAVLCIDNSEVKNLSKEIKDKKIITYGFNEEAAIIASNLRLDSNGFIFDVTINKKEKIKGIHLPMYGKHNVLNALAAISVAIGFDINHNLIKSSLAMFMGVKRRLTITGTINKITIIDDYGHHPTEIKASLSAVKEMNSTTNQGNVIAIVQPHRYSRVYDLFNDFANCFTDADKIFICDIYAAGEKEIDGINKDSLVKAIKETGKEHVFAIKNIANIANEIKAHITNGDSIICLGAGDITKYANSLPKELQKLS
jgi:UDP-N-acetylmuramate--alanine ligase